MSYFDYIHRSNAGRGNNIKRHLGVTLVELMVAMALGLLLTFIMGTMYLSSTQTFRAASQVARLQENLRFGSFYIQNSLREVGYTPCGVSTNVNTHLDTASSEYWITDGIFGWEFQGTGAGDTINVSYELVSLDALAATIATARNDNGALASDFETSLSGAAISLPSVIEDLNPIEGSDILALAVDRETSMRSLAVAIPGFDEVDIDYLASQQVGLGSIVKFGSCTATDKFQNINAIDATDNFIQIGLGGVAGYVPGNRASYSSPGIPWQAPHPAGSRVAVETLRVYYVGTGASGIPSLFLYESECGVVATTVACANAVTNQELVEGVENLQVFYGVDLTGDGVANRYVEANNVADFGTVVSIRFGLMMRSLTTAEFADSSTYQIADEVTVNPDDLNVTRYVSNSTVNLRNNLGN